MTAPNSDRPPSPRRRFWKTAGLIVGAGTLVLGAGAALFAWVFIHERLAPLLTQQLTKSLARPIKVGEVERVTLNSIRVGPTQLGATPTDPTRVNAEAVTVHFNLLDALLSRQLEIDLTLFEADGYVEQSQQEGWQLLELPEQADPDPKIRLDEIYVRNSRLTLAPDRPGVAPIQFEQLNGSVDFDELEVKAQSAQRIGFSVDSDLVKGGGLTLSGEIEPVDLDAEGAIQRRTKLNIQAQEANLPEVLDFTLATIGQPNSSVSAEAGEVSGNLTMIFEPDQPINYSGPVSVQAGVLNIAQLATPIRNLTAKTQWQGSEVKVDSASADYGALSTILQGAINFQTGYDLTARLDDVTVEAFTETFQFTVPVELAGVFDGEIDITGPLAQPQLVGTVTATDTVTVDRLQFETLSTDIALRLPSQALTFENIVGVPTVGGELVGAGVIDFDQQPLAFRFDLDAEALPADAIATLYDVSSPITLGRVAGNVTVAGTPGDVATTVRWQAPEAQYPGQGVLTIANGAYTFSDTTVQVGGGTLNGSGILANQQWSADINAAGIALNQFSSNLQGLLSGDFQLAGNTQNIGLDAVQGQGNFRVQGFADGDISGVASLDQGQWMAGVSAQAIQLNQLAANLRGSASGQLALSGRTDNLSLAGIRAQGDVALSDGLAALSPQFASLNQPLTSTLAWNGQQLQIERASSNQLQASGIVIPQLRGNQLTGIQRFDLALSAQGYPMAELPIPLPAAIALNGLASFDGRLTGTPSAPNLVGNLRLNDFGVNQLAFEPLLTGTISYTGADGLALAVAGERDAIALNANSGRDFDFQVDWQDAFARGNATAGQLNAELGNFPLAVLDLPPGGLGEFGQLRGTVSSESLVVNLDQRTLMGDVAINDFGLGYIGVERLAGEVRYANDLATLMMGELIFENSAYQVSGLLRLGDQFSYSANLSTQQGDIQDVLTAFGFFDLSDLVRGVQPPPWFTDPVPAEQLPGVLATQPTGDPRATLLNQIRRLAEIQALQEQAEVEATQAPLPPLEALTGSFAGTVDISGRQGTEPEIAFDLEGRDWQWGEDYTAEQVIARGSFIDRTLTLEPLRFETTVLTESATLDESIAAAQGEPLSGPHTLTELVNVAGQFSFNRDDDQDIDDASSNLQLVAQNISIENVRQIFNLPLSLEGRLNGTASLGGNLANPLLRGSLLLADGAINNEPIESAQAQFLYQDAQLRLFSSLTAQDNPNPLELRAQIPYAFNFMEVQPADDSIILDIEVEDEGLALLSVLNRQITWESGRGKVSLAVRGTLLNPQINGFATLEEATIRAKLLPQPLTNITGSARFDGDLIVVDRLQGRFSDGQVAAIGTFPLGNPIISTSELAAIGTQDEDNDPFSNLDLANLTSSDPLTVSLENAALTLTIPNNDDPLYDGDVDGRIVLGGSLNPLLGGPQLGGGVRLSQGRIFLPGGGGDSAATPVAEVEAGAGLFTPRFQNLNLILGRNVQIIQGSLLNFVARGSLQIDGPVNELSPNGVIQLLSGRINLFTTSFRLAGRDNTATFSPERGLQDPILNVQLRASVAEATQTGLVNASPFAAAEVTDTSIDPFSNTPGSLRTVRIRASVNGPASQIFDNLVLSSSPPRTQSEIIGLIGGSFISALESGGSGDIGGVVTFVGGALLNSLQNFVSRTLNLSEFRLFPVTSASQLSSDENTGSTLDIGGEIGFDITDALTVSILKILTDSTPPQYSLRYQLTDEFNIRATTDLDDINRVFLEFETRF
ncbi:MAG: translocation/assembly module TamB domain-containing protein [Cyanobacteria bacterium P01_A01_bin.114]